MATVAMALPPVASAEYEVTIRRTDHGIPHVVAADWGDLAYGYGYALAEDNICTLADVICAGGGADRVRGAGGNDVVRGGGGRDRVSGGKGDDELHGERGRDVLRGGPGKDQLFGGPGRDRRFP